MTPQRFTSAKTSRSQVPALHRALLRAGLWVPGDVNADIGGGKYDHATEALAMARVGNVVYDPFNRSEEWNRAALAAIEDGVSTATVANVLNVIAEPEVRAEVVALACRCARIVYFTVYEGDRSGVGKKTRDGWQENRKLGTFLPEIEPYFDHATVAVVEGIRCIVGVNPPQSV